MKTIIILGGGLTTDYSLPLWVKDRCDKAIKIFNNDPDNFNIVTASGGSYHYKPKISGNFIEFESCIIAKYLIDNGIRSDKICRESSSYDTIGNMFFIKTTITDPLDLKKLIIVTSDFHMDRSKILADFIFNLDNKYNLEYIETVTDIDNDIFNKRIEKETSSLKKFINDMKEINNLKDFTKWLYTQHNCYKPLIICDKKIDYNLLYQ
jgi:hypothetical protein